MIASNDEIDLLQASLIFLLKQAPRKKLLY